MADKTRTPQVTLDVSKSMELVATASEAQAAKLREVLSRIDVITKIDRESLRNLTDVLDSAKADGGCGIGCW
jgi:hypothetical protein